MRGWRGNRRAGGGGGEGRGGRDGVFLSETSLNTEHLPDSRLMLEAEQEGRWRGLRRQICVHSCV